MDPGLSELLATADELYALVPEAFTAARDERVRTLRRAGSRARALAVKELRRPSVSAWLVNALVRHRRSELERLLRLGEALREAQQSLDADQLRELNRQRQTVLAAIGREARGLAAELGRPVSEHVADEVEETLRAALSDPAAANAVRSGRLTSALRYAGFGETDLDDAVALPRARTALAGLFPAQEETSGHRSADDDPRTAAAPPPDGAEHRPRYGLAPRETAQEDPREQAPREQAARDRAAREQTARDRAARDDEARQAAVRQAALREAHLAARAAEEASRQAEGAALVAEQHRDAVERRARSALQRLEHYQARVADLESQLASARQAAAAAAAGWAPLHSEAEAASARAEAGRGVAERTRATAQAARAHLTEVKHSGSTHPATTGIGSHDGAGEDGDAVESTTDDTFHHAAADEGGRAERTP